MTEKSILIIDNDQASLNFLKRIFEEQQFKVLQTRLGKEGLIYAWRDRPDLIVFDPALRDINPEDFLQKLRQDARSAQVPVMALSNDPSEAQKQACLQLGCNEYLLKSGEIVSTLPEIVAKLMGTKKVIIKEGGLLIVFLSAKGGTGTSSLCANYAMAFRHNKPETSCVVVDLVLPIGSIAPIVGYKGETDIVSVAELPASKTSAKFFQQNLPRMQNWQFQLLPGASNPERANSLEVGRIPGILEELKTAFDYVVVDLGRSLSRISLPVIQKADMLVLIMGTDQSTITLTKITWDFLQAHDIDVKNVYVILNRAVGLEGLTKAEAEKILELPIKTAIPYMGSNFVVANNLNQPLIAKYPSDSASIAIKETAAELANLAESMRRK